MIGPITGILATTYLLTILAQLGRGWLVIGALPSLLVGVYLVGWAQAAFWPSCLLFLLALRPAKWGMIKVFG